MGSHYKSYCSDMTRTFLQDERNKEIYDIVKNANLLAIQAINTSMTLAQIDKVARDYISSFGYGENFTHRLGHGIGFSIQMFWFRWIPGVGGQPPSDKGNGIVRTRFFFRVRFPRV